jgi:DNA-binding CsgD family transcriptional regulator
MAPVESGKENDGLPRPHRSTTGEALLRVLVVASEPSVADRMRALLVALGGFEVVRSEHDAPDLAVVVEDAGPGRRPVVPDGLPAVQLGGVAPHRRSGVSAARGYLRAGATPAELVAAIHAVAAGLDVAGPGAGGPLRLGGEDDGTQPGLTPREVEVLALVAEGLPNKGIAQRLGISEHTAKFHVGAILSKLEAESRAEAVMEAARRGLLPL